MYLSTLYQPTITASVVAAVLGIALAATAWRKRAGIARALEAIRRSACNRNGFFWLVCVIFMSVSVLHAGVFFGITGNAHDVPGVARYLGFAVSFFLDLVTIILMQAMLEAKYRSDEPRARQFLLFIAICCSTSTFANLAISLNDFDAARVLPHAPWWIQIAAPYVLASFPLFVILMSIAAEMIINTRPLDSLNEEEYEADEKKRIRILQIRNDYLQRQADEELRALTIRATMQMNKRMRSGTLAKSFRWFWEKPVDMDAIIAGVSTQLKAAYAPDITALKQRLEEVKTPVKPPALPAWIPTQTPPAPDAAPTTGSDAGGNADSNRTAHGKPAQSPSHNTVLTVMDTAPATGSDAGGNADSNRTVSGKLPQTPPSHNAVLTALGNRRSVTVKEASQILGLSDSYVRDLRKNGTLRRSSSNPNLIVVSSILAYQETRQNAGKTTGRDTGALPSVTAPQSTHNPGDGDGRIVGNPMANGRSKETQPLGNLVPVEV